MAKDDKPVVVFEEPPEEGVEGGDRPPPWRDLTEESNIEVVEGDPNEKPKPEGPTYDELIAQVQAERAARVAAEGRVDPVASLTATLKEALASRDTPPTTPAPQQPGESDEDFSKRMKESFFEDPVSHLDKWSQRKLAPIVGQIASMTQAIARQQMYLDPDLGGTYKRFQVEVDRAVASRPDRFTNPDVYRDATRLIAGQHINELIQEAVAKAVATPATPAPAPAYSEAPGRPAPRKSPTQVKLTAGEIQEAYRQGMDPRDYYRSKYGKW